MPATVTVHKSERAGQQRLLPRLQLHQLRGEGALAVVGELLEEVDHPVCLLLVEEVFLILQVLDDPGI